MKLIKQRIGYFFFHILFLQTHFSFAAQPTQLILSDLQYIGAFRVSNTNNGIGRTGFSDGRIAISAATNSFFLSGNPFPTIAEFPIPDIINSTNIHDLAFTGPPLQNFTDFSNRIGYETPSNDIRNMGPMHIHNGTLIASVYDAYDAASSAGFDVDNMLMINDAFNLESSSVTGYFGMEDKMFAAGWLSPIPPNYKLDLGGDYLSGSARMASINGRWSMGPSAYSFNKTDLLNVSEGQIVPNTTLQKYTLFNRLHPDSFNYPRPHTEECPSFTLDPSLWKAECVLENDLFTEVSRAFYGAIIPGTSTYLTVGYVGGTQYGMGYKNYPINGGPQPCSGECPHDYTDWDNYIWLFNVEDLINHKNEQTEEYDARPYTYGAIKLPFDDLNNDGIISTISSADYDPLSNRLYLVLNRADRLASFEATPIVVVYEIALNRPKPPLLLIHSNE